MRRYLMIGAPVTSVRTPPLLAARLEQMGAPATVDAVTVEPEDLRDFMSKAKADHTLDGLMVTMPHKRAVCDFLDECSKTARQAGSVNAVKRLDERLVGAQFDGLALRSALGAADRDLATARVLLAGLGGAGLAIAHALHGHCGALLLCEIDKTRLTSILPALPLATPMRLGDEAAADILVNATPLGMEPDDPSPFDDAWVADARVVADIVADPKATRLAAQAQKAGTTLVTGRTMVEHQIDPIAQWLLSGTN